jgi:hypothetical protein
MDPPTPPDVSIDPHPVEHPFPFYMPTPAERFQLTPFPRTDVTVYIAALITPPDTFPVVREEQPVRERAIPTLDLDDPALKDVKPSPESPVAPLPVARVVQHPREIRFYPFDPAYCLRPQPVTLPELPDEIGKSSILALPLTGREKCPSHRSNSSECRTLRTPVCSR